MARMWWGAAALAIPVCLAGAEHHDSYQKTFALTTGGERRLVIENITGEVKVTGDSGSDIRITVREHWTAGSTDSLEQGRKDVRLEMTQSGNTVTVSVTGMSRNGREQWHQTNRSDEDYRFRYDFQVQVPRDIHLDLKTVNGSDISVADVKGEWHLKNVNGSIRMENVAGFGTAETVNGRVKAVFTENPSKASRFKTLNGTLDVTFQPSLNADLRLETMNGEAYTDFEIAPVTLPVAMERSGEGHRFRIGRNRAVRIGTGGMEHEFKTLNGSIRIRKYGTQ